MSEFKTYTLEQLCIVGSSKRVHLSDYVQQGIPFYRSKEVIEISSGKNISEQLFISSEKYSEIKSKFPVPQENDVLITAVGTIGEILVVKDPNFYFKDGNLIWLRNIDFDIIDIDYLYYFFKSDLFQKTIKYNNIGAVQKALTIDFLKTVKITLPSLDNQRKLVSVLKSIDKKIQTNNQIIQELETMAKTLYDYWFVQFDFPDQNGKPYKSSGGKMVYHPELKREIPEGWGVTTFSSWISDNKTGDWGKETSQGNYTLEVDCIRGADINGLSGNGKTDMPTRFILEKNKNKLLTDFDIVIEISGGSPTQSTGRIVGISENVLNRFDLPLICSNFCKAVSLKEQETFYNFVYEWKNLYDNGVLFSWEGKTSGIKNLLFDSFVTNYHIAQPPIDLMKQFFDYASSVDKKTQLLLKQNQELTQLRDWLLPMLMNGQVKVE